MRHSQEEGVNWTLPLGAFCPQLETHTPVRFGNSRPDSRPRVHRWKKGCVLEPCLRTVEVPHGGSSLTVPLRR